MEGCRGLWFATSLKLEGLFMGGAACMPPPGVGSVSSSPADEA